MDTKDLVKLSEDLECAVCMEVFTDPRVLICQHVFCLGCLDKLAKDRGMITCPTCRKDTLIIKDNGVGDLPKPFIINRVSDTLSSLQHKYLDERDKNQTATRVCCLCEEKNAAHFCHECIIYLCEKCHESHLKIPCFSEHKATALKELLFCDDHVDIIAKQYCEACDKVVCIKCLLGPHKGHTIKDADSVSKRKEQEIHRQQELLAEKIKSLEDSIRKLHDMEEKNKKHFETCVTSIVGWTSEVTAMAQAHSNKLLSKLETDKTEQSELINSSRKEQMDILSKISLQQKSLGEMLSSKRDMLLYHSVEGSQRPEKYILSMDRFRIPEIKTYSVNLEEKAVYNFSSGLKSTKCPEPAKESASSGAKVGKTETMSCLIMKEETSQWKVVAKKMYNVKQIIDLTVGRNDDIIWSQVIGVNGYFHVNELSKSGELKDIQSLGKYHGCNGVAFDNISNSVYAVISPSTVHKFDSNMTFTKYDMIKGVKKITGIAFCPSTNHLATIDQENSLVHILRTSDFKMVRSFSVMKPTCIASCPGNGILITSSKGTKKLQIHNEDGKLLNEVDFSFISMNSLFSMTPWGDLYGSNETSDDSKGAKVWKISGFDQPNESTYSGTVLLDESAVKETICGIAALGPRDLVTIGKPNKILFLKMLD